MSFGIVSQAGSSTWVFCGAARTRGSNPVKQRSSRILHSNSQVDAAEEYNRRDSSVECVELEVDA